MTPRAPLPPRGGLMRRLGLIGLLLVAFALRVAGLGEQELRGDEAFGYFFSLPPFSEIVRRTFELREPHPVASYLLQHLWLDRAGHSEFALRYLSALCGVIAAGATYRIGRHLQLGHAVAAGGALLMALSPYAIWHSQDARMYGMSLALTALSGWLALAAHWPPRRHRWLLYVLVSWLALHTHYFSLFVLVAQNLFFGAYCLANRAWGMGRSWLRSQLAIALLYAPWLWAARDILTGYGGNGDSPSLVPMLQRTLSVFAVGESLPMEQRLIVAAPVALLLGIGMIRLVAARGAQRWAAAFLALYLAVPVALSWYGSWERPIFNERYLIAAATPFYLLLSAAVGPLRERRALPLRGLATVALLVVGVAGGLSLRNSYTEPAYSKSRGWRELATAIDSEASGYPLAAVRLAQNLPDPTLNYYYRGPIAAAALPPAPHDAEGARRQVEAWVAEGVEAVILPVQPSGAWDDADIALEALAERFTLISERPVGSWPLALYVRADPAALRLLDVRFTNGVTLESGSIQEVRRTGDARLVALFLRWRGTAAALDGSEKLFIHLLDRAGAVVAQSDPPFPVVAIGGESVAYALQLPADLPDGEYRVIVGGYSATAEGMPRFATAEGQDHVEVGRLIIEP